MEEYKNKTYDEERALYAVKNVVVENCRFDGPADGESALKESSDITVRGCYMNLRYPFWHVTNAHISNCELTPNCRAALWYDKNVVIENCKMNGIKALRECSDVVLKSSTVSSPEFIWKCRDLVIEDVNILESEYPFFEVENAKITKLKIKGKYSFQYCSNIEITDSELNTKDAFWHTKNVTVRDTVINGEYLGWYSENLTLINCRIVGTQPFCYCKNLTLKNCVMEKCDLSFERSTVNAEVLSSIDSIKNPLGGKIVAESVGELIMDKDVIGDTKTTLHCKTQSFSIK
ncbi:MAG: DUF3737 family protein [Treponema sp.]|nr:DUF3737 family protein [Treponema sp.]